MSTQLITPERHAPTNRSRVPSDSLLPEADKRFGWHKLYPFEPRSVSVAGCRYHYIDECTGEAPDATLLFVHGNPTWSFHWRGLVSAWRTQYRCIAVDHLGCGFSERPAKSLRLADHIDNLVEFLDKLDLDNVTLVAQDWGGSIGLGTILRRRERFRRIVLFNTGAFRPRPYGCPIPWRIRVCRTPVLGRLAVQGANLFARAAQRMTLARKHHLDKTVRDGCLAPYDNWAARRGIYDFVEDIPASPRHPTWKTLESIERGLPSLGDMPILLVWGMQDWCFTPACLEKFCEFWPHADVRRLEDVGHWVVEDAPEEARKLVAEYLAATTGRVVGAVRCTVAEAAYLACALEATAPKPGNVHPHAAFADLTYDTMLRSAAAISQVLAEAREVGVGRTILRAVEAMREAAGTNAHLGAILLLAPLAVVDDGQSHQKHICDILAALDEEDTEYVYAAIRVAHPGGLGDSTEADVRDIPPPLPLVEVMRLAADRDLVARQYVNGFETVFHEVATPLKRCVERGWDLLDAIVYVEIRLLARHGDSLIGRKCGRTVADEARDLARELLAKIDAATGNPLASVEVQTQLAGFNKWLRADGNRRNPGTTADLIAAGLFVLLSAGRLDATAARTAIAAATNSQ